MQQVQFWQKSFWKNNKNNILGGNFMYQTTAKITGDDTTYQLNPSVKKYSLRDVGFEESKTGKFTLTRSLDVNSPYNSGYLLKVVVAKDLKTFKLATTAKNGLAKVNIFKGQPEEIAARKQQLGYILGELVDRNILQTK